MINFAFCDDEMLMDLVSDGPNTMIKAKGIIEAKECAHELLLLPMLHHKTKVTF